jgi:FMN-dependent NADH-azoreductase
MKTLLQINTSLFSGHGQSTQLAERFVQAYVASHPDTRVIVRDFAKTPVPHLDGARAQAFFTPAEQRTPAQAAIIAESDALIDELKSADIVVLGLPMYNFGVPSSLKAYFDHLARAGVTFRYTPTGPEGLISDRKFYILAARGGLYLGTDRDTQTGYVKTFLNFLGIKDIEFVYAEGLNISAEAKQAALDKAGAQIAKLAS